MLCSWSSPIDGSPRLLYMYTTCTIINTCFSHMEQKVFVGLHTGDLLVYERDPGTRFNEFWIMEIVIGVHAVLTTLNSYLYVHWIFDFK